MSNYEDSHFNEKDKNTSWYKVFQLIPSGSSVLDIGCSSGNFGAELIKRKKCIVDGIELDKNDVTLAKKQLHKVYQMNIETDDISSLAGRYDIVYMGDVVEHLFYTVETLKKCKNLLKKDGVFIFSVPNMAHIAIRLLLLRGDFNYTETGLLDKTHIHFFNLKEVYRVFEEAGYVIDKLDFVEKDYPKGLIEKWCRDMGIRVTKKFLNNCQSIEAAAFQFVGVARPGNITHHTLPQFGPIDFFETYHQNITQSLESRLFVVEQENKKLKEENQSIMEQNKQITSLLPYRVAKKIKKAIRL